MSFECINKKSMEGEKMLEQGARTNIVELTDDEVREFVRMSIGNVEEIHSIERNAEYGEVICQVRSVWETTPDEDAPDGRLHLTDSFWMTLEGVQCDAFGGGATLENEHWQTFLRERGFAV